MFITRDYPTFRSEFVPKQAVEVKLQSRAARARLKPREDPYWRAIGDGRHLGYFKGPRRGRWVARIRLDEQYVKERIGDADDVQDADGSRVLSWDQAMDKAMAWFSARVRGVPLEQADREPRSRQQAKPGVPTLGEVLEAYMEMRDRRASSRAGRKIKSDARRLERHVLKAGKLGGVRLDALDEGMLVRWRAKLTGSAGSRERTSSDFKAALNGAFLEYRRLLPPDFLTVVKFGLRTPDSDVEGMGSGVRDNQILSDAIVRRIVASAFAVDETGDLGRLVMLLAATGARFSQIARMRVSDVQPEFSRVIVPSSRKGKSKVVGHARVQVGEDVIEALRPILTDREPTELLLQHWRFVQKSPTVWERDYRGPWQAAAELTRPWQRVLTDAGLVKIVPYALRHSSIVRGIRFGLPIRLVAALHDTSVVMIERHYSRWITEGLDELAARAVVPMVAAPQRMAQAA